MNFLCYIKIIVLQDHKKRRNGPPRWTGKVPKIKSEKYYYLVKNMRGWKPEKPSEKSDENSVMTAVGNSINH